MHILVFGNPDLAVDSLPLRILPDLRKHFPEIVFTEADPNEEWDVEGSVIALDTVREITKVTCFEDLKHFRAAPRVTGHDFDALSNLRLLQKTDRIHHVKIIGIPPMISENEALEAVSAMLRAM